MIVVERRSTHRPMENAMRPFLPPILTPSLTVATAALTACAPAPQEPARAPDPVAGAEQVTGSVPDAVQGPAPEPVSAAGMLHPGDPLARAASTDPASTDDASDTEAQGRRTLSTAFVRLKPGGHLLVTLRGGAVIALRDVTMEKAKFCGVAVTEGALVKRRCHAYAEVAAARAVDAPTGMEPVSAGPGVAATERAPGR